MPSSQVSKKAEKAQLMNLLNHLAAISPTMLASNALKHTLTKIDFFSRNLFYIHFLAAANYSKTPIYRGFWGKGNNRGKSGFAVNRGFACLQYAYQALFGG